MAYEHLTTNWPVADRLNEINRDVYDLAKSYNMDDFLKDEINRLYSHIDELVTAIYPE